MTTMKVKKWVIDKAQMTATRYNTFIDMERGEDGTPRVEDGYVTVIVEKQLSETEKAVNVVLSTGKVLGSVKGWTLWIPKSQIA